jgi:hypothetical protein
VVGTLAYAVRIAGIRTRRIAISFSLFTFWRWYGEQRTHFRDRFWRSGSNRGCWEAISRWWRISAGLANRDDCHSGWCVVDSDVPEAVQRGSTALLGEPVD